LGRHIPRSKARPRRARRRTPSRARRTRTTDVPSHAPIRAPMGRDGRHARGGMGAPGRTGRRSGPGKCRGPGRRAGHSCGAGHNYGRGRNCGTGRGRNAPRTNSGCPTNAGRKRAQTSLAQRCAGRAGERRKRAAPSVQLRISSWVASVQSRWFDGARPRGVARGPGGSAMMS